MDSTRPKFRRFLAGHRLSLRFKQPKSDYSVAQNVNEAVGSPKGLSNEQLVALAPWPPLIAKYETFDILDSTSHIPGVKKPLVVESLWLAAQKSSEVTNDTRWPAFSANFGAVSDVPSIDSVIAGFAALSTSKLSRTRHIQDSIVDFAEHVKRFGDSIIQLDPSKYALAAWGLLSLLVTAAVKARDTHKIARNFTAVSLLKRRCDIFVRLYLETPALTTMVKEELMESMTELFVKVLKFSMVAWDYLQGSRFNHAVKSFLPGDAVKAAFDDLMAAEELVNVNLQCANADVTSKTYAATSDIQLQLQDISEPLSRMLSSIDSIQKRLDDEAKSGLLDWICDLREGQDLDAHLHKRHSGTCHWFLDSPELNDFMQAGESSALHISGDIGSGKSVLAAALVDELLVFANQYEGNAVAYAFYGAHPGHRASYSNPSYIIRSLLKQTIQQCWPQLPHNLNAMYSRRKDSGRKLSSEEATELLLESSDFLESLTIVIDGLDGCDPDMVSYVFGQLLEIQSGLSIPVKIVTTSRSRSTLNAVAKDMFHPHIAIMNVQSDIELFIKSRVASMFQRSFIPPEVARYQADIVHALVGRADGMFQWAACALALLTQKRVPCDLLESIQKLPPGVNELYESIYDDLFEKTGESGLAIIDALGILLYSRVDLSCTELLEVVMPEQIRRQLYDPRSFLLSMCANFLELDRSKDRFCFTHGSVTDFLKTKIPAGPANTWLALLCVDKTWKFLASPKIHWQAGTFMAYALCHWPWHVSEVARLETDHGKIAQLERVLGQAMKCLRGSSPASATWFYNGLSMLRNAFATQQRSDSSSSRDHDSLQVEMSAPTEASDVSIALSDVLQVHHEDLSAFLALERSNVFSENPQENIYGQGHSMVSLVSTKTVQTVTSDQSLDELLDAISERPTGRRSLSYQDSRRSSCSAPRSLTLPGDSFSPIALNPSFHESRSTVYSGPRPEMLSTWSEASNEQSMQSMDSTCSLDAGSLESSQSVRMRCAKIRFKVDSEQNDLRDAFSLVMSIPPNPLFAACAWNVPDIVQRMAPNQDNLWRQKNVLGMPPVLGSLVMRLRMQPIENTTCLPNLLRTLQSAPLAAWEAGSATGLRPMHLACEKAPTLATLLLAAGISANVVSDFGNTPLEYAMRRGDFKFVRHLLHNGAAWSFDPLCNKDGLWLAVANAVRSEKGRQRPKPDFWLLSIACPGLFEHQTAGYSFLHVAAAYGSTGLAEACIDADVNLEFKAQNSFGATALHIAANSENSGVCEIAETLLEAGADVSSRDALGRRPLHLAASAAMTVLLLRRKADLSILDDLGRTPLRAAIARGAWQAASIMLRTKRHNLNSDDVARLPFNISYATTVILQEHGFFPSVSINVKPSTDDFGSEPDELDESLQETEDEDAFELHGEMAPKAHDAGHEEARIRQMRIQADELNMMRVREARRQSCLL